MLDHKSYIPHTIEVIGYDYEAEQILIWSRINKHLYKLRDFGQITDPMLIKMAGWAAVDYVQSLLSEDMSLTSLLKKIVAEECRQIRIDSKEALGVGVWKHPVDPGLLVVTGNECYSFHRDNNRILWKAIDRPLVGDKLIENGQQWVNPTTLQNVSRTITRKLMKAKWQELLDAIACWSFRDKYDHLLIAGLAVATFIQGAMTELRPQVSVVGKSYTGKTRLKLVLNGLWPYAHAMEGTTSAAGIAQSIRVSALPILLDEQESWHGRQQVLNLIRSSTSAGGEITKGSASGKPVSRRLNHIFWMFAVDDGLREEADINRFARFTLSPPDKGLVIPPRTYLVNLGMDLLLTAMINADDIVAMSQSLNGYEEFRTFGRMSRVYAVPVAVWAVINSVPEAEARALLLEVVEEKSRMLGSKNEGDEKDLLSEILHCVPRGSDAPIARLLADPWDKDLELQTAGIRKIEWTEQVAGVEVKRQCVFFAHRVIARHLSLGPKWAGRDLGDLLERIPGAERSKQRIHKIPEWGVMLPLDEVLPVDEEDLPF